VRLLVLSERDLATKPIIKKPRTFNPLGGVFAGLFLGIGHALITKSFIKSNAGVGIGILGIILAVLSIAPCLAAISLSPKFALFNTIIEKSRNIIAQITFQIIIFYVGFLPIYGFSIVYTVQGFELWKMIVLGVIQVVLVGVLYILNLKILQREKPSFGHLQKMFYQPNKVLIIALSLIPSIISTLILVFI
jgi:hypothetical protein